MPHLHADTTPRAPNRPYAAPAFPDPFADHLQARARNRLHAEVAPVEASSARVIEVGGVTAGIAVTERGGVRFFSSEPRFDPLDGAVFGSVERAAKAARDRFRALTQPRAPARPRSLSGGSPLRVVR